MNAPLPPADVDAIRAGYAFDGEVLEIGALVNGAVMPDVQVRIPIAMLNRHGTRRRSDRNRQDTHPAGARRTAVQRRGAGVRRRHQGRPVRRGDPRRVQREAARPHRRHRAEVVQRQLSHRVLQPRRHRDGRSGAGDAVGIRADAAVQGARAQRHAGVLARPGVPLRRERRPAAGRPRRPARGPHLAGRRGQERTAATSAVCPPRPSVSSCAN